MSEPLQPVDEGVLLELEVTPGASQDAFPAGFNPWRGRVQARVSAQAQDGAANQALLELVADALSLHHHDVELVRGHTSRQKTLLLRGADEARVRDALRGVLEA